MSRKQLKNWGFVVSVMVFACLLLFPIFCLSGCKGGEKLDSNINEVKIGILAPFTGPSAQYGTSIFNGIKLCFDEINSAGGINGTKINYIRYDEEDAPPKAIAGYSELLGDGVCGIIGDVTTATTMAIVQDSVEDNMPLITPTASAREVTYDDVSHEVNENVFRICYTNAFQSEKMAEFAKNHLNARTASIVFCAENDYSIELKDAFAKKCDELGIKILDTLSFPAASIDFTAQIANATSDAPDVLFLPYYYEKVALFADQLRSAGFTGTMLGVDGWGSVTSLLNNPNLLDGSYYFSSYSNDDPSLLVQDFKASYENAYGSEPNMFAAQGYDAAKVFAESLKTTIKNGANPKNSLEFRKAIISNLATTDLGCVTGHIVFDEHHNPIKNAIIMKIIDGKEMFYERF